MDIICTFIILNGSIVNAENPSSTGNIFLDKVSFAFLSFIFYIVEAEIENACSLSKLQAGYWRREGSES